MSDNTERLKHLMLTRLRGRHFALLNSVVELGSIHRAAARHGLSQPGASKLLREVEAVVGLPLFDRTPQGTVPTVYGLRASKLFRALDTEIEYLAHDLEVIRSGRGGVVRVGVINFISRSMIVEAIMALWHADHRLVVHVANGTSEGLLASLVSLELDCVIGRRAPSRNTADITFQPIYRQEPCILAHGTKGTGPRAEDLDLAHLATLRWVLPPKGTPGRAEFDRMVIAAGLTEPETVVESGDLDLIYHLVRSEPDIRAMLPSDVGEELVAKGGVRTTPFVGDFRYPPVGIMELRRGCREPAVDLFCRSMTAAAGKRERAQRRS